MSTLVTSFPNNQILFMFSRNEGIKVNPHLCLPQMVLVPLYFTDKCLKTIRVIKLIFHYLINGGNSKYTDKIHFTVF